MGFFSKLFGPPQVKQYSLEESIKLIENELESLQSKNKEESYLTAVKVYDEMKQLGALISDFSKKEVPDLAKSSANVKDRFCTLSERQLKNMNAPSRLDFFQYLSASRIILDSLGGLTQRQMLHINFFFKEDFKPVAKKINEIHAMLSISQNGGDHAKAVQMYRRIAELENRKAGLEMSISSEEQKLKLLQGKHHQLPELAAQPNSYDLDRSETKLKVIKQDTDSFLAVQKLLKKYAYVTDVKDPLLDSYIESPNTGLSKDNNLQIIEFVQAASVLVSEGKIDFDKPEKLGQILAGEDYITRKRSDLITANNEVDEERRRLRRAQEIFETSLKARTNRLAEIEGEIKALEKSIAMQKEEETSTTKEITKTRTELTLLASRLLDANVS